MTIGFNTSGADQDTIADGVDESDGRWHTIVDHSLTSSSPRPVTEVGSGAVPQYEFSGASMQPANDGDDGGVAALGPVPYAFPWSDGTGSILIKTVYFTNNSIGSISDDHVIGWYKTFAITAGADNIAVFNPTAGDSASGNIRVDVGGTDYNESISYPSITEPHEYTVLLDYAGHYLNQGESGFYVDSDPRDGSDPDAVISQVPTPNTDNTAGFGMTSNGSNDYFHAHHLEVSWRL